MKRSITALAAAAIIATTICSPAFAQGAPQTIILVKVDPQSVATGYRTSKVVGSTVYNEANESVGTVDDLIITPSDNVPYAVLSVGGFLGIDKKYVVVRAGSLEVSDKKLLLRGASKDSLKALPAFKYAN
jgi:hypothetical protein